jgi:hypothetical protein
MLTAGERQAQQRARRVEGVAQQRGEHFLGHRVLVRRHRQAALGDVEHPLGGAAVGAGIVQHALGGAERGQQLGREAVAVDRQRQLARQAVAVEDEGVLGQARDVAATGEVAVEEGLDALVGRRQHLAEQTALLAVVGEQVARHRQEFAVTLGRHHLVAERRELEGDVADQLAAVAVLVDPLVAQAQRALHVHGGSPR